MADRKFSQENKAGSVQPKFEKTKPAQRKQDLVAELNNALSVRAEQIRHRMANERQEAFRDLNLDLVETETVECDDYSENKGPVEQNLSQIPVSRARLRRRQKHKANKQFMAETYKPKAIACEKRNRGASTVDIKNYRPGYTWSRGGRIKELRIRCLARKYLAIWQRKTFGRVPLAVAKQHYEEVLLSKAFGAWYEYWWEIVKEWRLGVRAECHHRYKLWNWIFDEWKEFVLLKRVRNAKMAKADRHFDNHILMLTFGAWRFFIIQRKKRCQLLQKAEEFREAQIIKHAWVRWKKSFLVALHRQEAQSLALQFWSYRVQAQHWLIWKAALEMRNIRQEQYTEAVVYHNSTVVSRCMHAWTLYVRNRRAKKSHADFAKRVFNANLKLHAFNHWYLRWRLHRSFQQHQLKIEALGATFRQRWGLWRWRIYVTQCKEQKRKEALADEHYKQQILRIGFDSFRLNVVHSHIKAMRIHLAQQLRQKQLLTSAWSVWIKALDAVEERKIAPHTELATEHYREKMLSQCFSSLWDYAQWRQHRKAQYARADAHYYLHTVPKCLFHMRIFVQLEKTCRENTFKASQFKRQNVMCQTFTVWNKAATRSKDDRMMYRMAVLHRESVLVHNMFFTWRLRSYEAEVEHKNMCQAHEHYLFSLCQRAWDGWTAFVISKKKRARNEYQAIHHCYMRTVHLYLEQWRKWLAESKRKRALYQKAIAYHARKSLTLCVSDWKIFVVHARKFKEVADIRYQQHCDKLLRLAFVEWRRTVAGLVVNKRKYIAASVHHNRCLMVKVTQAWHHTAVLLAYQRSQKHQMLLEAVTHLEHLKLTLYFKLWQEKTVAALSASELWNVARRHHSYCAQRRAMNAWKEYNRTCLRKRLLSRQCQWFHDVRVSAKCWFLWRQRLREEREEKNKTCLALWQWSFVLQRKALLALKAYAEIRRHQKARFAEAASVRRKRLLHGACGQWLATADSLNHLRSQTAARHQAKTAFDNFHLVQRCALHWKLWAKRQRSSRGHTRKPGLASMVTSTALLSSKLSRFPVVTQVYPGEAKLSRHKDVHLRPIHGDLSPAKPLQGVHIDRLADTKTKVRPPPKRPAFLVDSLKRAGLYSNFVESHDSLESEMESTPSLSDLRVEMPSPDYPSTGRFDPHKQVHNQRIKADPYQDWSLSAEVMSGSTSTLGPGEGAVKPLHLSQSDTDQSALRTNSTSSHSPHIFTPSTQRSQFSGNPLLYSSPLSDTNIAKEAGRMRPVMRQTEGLAHALAGLDEGLRVTAMESKANMFGNQGMVSGNLEGAVLSEHTHLLMKQGLQKLELWQRQQQKIDQEEKQYAQGVEEDVVLLKPEDFMKKVSGHHVKQTSPGLSEVKKTVLKHTPRTFATHDTDQTSGLPPPGDKSTGRTNSSSAVDSLKENVGPLRHTPREVSSPRRTAPQGILHNKMSDSDGDASPLNTARSRGTVTFASPKSPSAEEEITNIRDRLRHFSEQKQRLRSLRRQYRQLSDGLVKVSGKAVKDEDEEDDDHKNTSEELHILRLEVEELQAVVESQRPICERLVLRAQILAKELNIPMT